VHALTAALPLMPLRRRCETASVHSCGARVEHCGYCYVRGSSASHANRLVLRLGRLLLLHGNRLLHGLAAMRHERDVHLLPVLASIALQSP